MTSDYRDNWPISNEYLIELGRMTALWASLESLLNTCIGKLAGFDPLKDPTSFILVAHSSFPQRLDILGALCERMKEEYKNLEDHKAVIAMLKKAQTNRNRYSHNGLVFDEQTAKYYLPEASARGKMKASVTPVTLEEVHAVSKEVHLATLALYKLVFINAPSPVWERPV